MNMDLSSYQAILFDVDGTLAETEGLGHLPAFNAAFEQLEISWKWDAAIYKVLLRITGGLERLKAYRSMQEKNGVSELNPLPDDTMLKKIHMEKNRIYARLVEEGSVRTRPGLIDFINQLSAHRKVWGIVTTTSRANWDRLWEKVLKTNLQTEPAIVICGEDVLHKKPDPEAYLLAAQRLDLPPQSCLAIEDSENGMIAAHSAGMEVLVVRSQFFMDGNFSSAKYRIDEFTDMKLLS
jgi:HAD superfamily hydrolase (TIGR01509 family)